MAVVLPAVGGRLFTLFRTIPAFVTDQVAVYNGPSVSAGSDRDLVLVNDDGDPESDASSTYEQEWADLAATSRYERGLVICGVISQSGSTDPQARQDRVAVLMGACSAALHADVTLGGLVLTAQFQSGSTTPVQNSAGAAVRAPFAIAYLAQVAP
jgi:hypothetical protein